MATDSVPTPPCAFCGEPTHPHVENLGDEYVCAVACDSCDSYGPPVYGSIVEDVVARAVEKYSRATAVRDLLLAGLQAYLYAVSLGHSDETAHPAWARAEELAREAVAKFTLAGERRSPR